MSNLTKIRNKLAKIAKQTYKELESTGQKPRARKSYKAGLKRTFGKNTKHSQYRTSGKEDIRTSKEINELINFLSQTVEDFEKVPRFKGSVKEDYFALIESVRENKERQSSRRRERTETGKLVNERNRLAKIANQRKAELERAGIRFGAVNSYDELVEAIYTENGTKKTKRKRFREKGRYDPKVEREIRYLKEFINMPTSTVEGIQTKLAEQMKTTEIRYGVKFNDIGDYELFIKFMTEHEFGKILGSDRVLRMKEAGYTADDLKLLFDEYNEKFNNEDTDKEYLEVAKALGFETTLDMEKFLYVGRGSDRNENYQSPSDRLKEKLRKRG